MPGVRSSLALLLAAVWLAAAATGCGGSSAPHVRTAALRASATTPSTGVVRRRRVSVKPPAPVALVTAQTQDRLLVISLPSGRVIRRVAIPGDPEYAASFGVGGPAVVVSARSGTVSLLGGTRLKREARLQGWSSPHIPAMSPDGGYAYVTDDATGRVAAIQLSTQRVDSRLFVGAGAHHLAFSPDAQHVWVALGQSARRIVLLSTVVSSPPPPSSPTINPGHPRVVGRFSPGYLVHDLLFTPDGRRVWVTAANRSSVGVFSARGHRLLFRVPAGPPPQHVVFAGGYAYVTSGYGSQIEQVVLASGRVRRRERAPYGSFDLDATGRYVVTSSLFLGTVAIYDRNLRLLRVRRVAPSAEDVAIYRP